MVPWMTWLKLGREMWTHPGKANADKFTKVWIEFSNAFWHFCKLGPSRGFKNVLGKAVYPCK